MFLKTILLLCVFSLINISDAQSLKLKLTDQNSNVETIAVSPNGKMMATGAWNGQINLYTYDSSRNPVFKETFKGHMGTVTCLNFSPNSKYLVSGSKDFSIRLWNIDTPSNSKVFNLHSEPITSAFLDSKNKFLTSSSLDGDIRFTYINQPKKSRVVKIGVPINDLLLSKDKKFYYVALKGSVIKKYQTGGKNLEVQSFEGHTDEVNAIEISPDGFFLASASNDKTIQIWNLRTGKSIKTLIGFEWKVTSVKFSSDGKYVIGGCNNGVTKLFEVETGKNISDFNEFGSNVRDVEFSRDATEIIVATFNEGEEHGAVIYTSGVSAIVPTSTSQKKQSPKKTNGSR